MQRTKRLIPMNLQLFAADPVPTDPQPPIDPQDPPNAPEPDKVVPYDRFKAVNDEKKALADQLKALSAFGSPDDLAAKIERLAALEKDEDERKKAQMSELERIQAERDEAANKAADLEAKLAELAAARDNDKIEFAIRAAATDAVDIEDVLNALKGAVKVEEDGTVNVADALAALKEKKPHYFAKEAPKQPKTIGADGVPAKQGDVSTLEAQVKEAKERYQKTKQPADMQRFLELDNKLKQTLKK